mgnify:FL=1
MAEGVAAVLEVKSDLCAQWEQVENTVEKVKSLSRKYKDAPSNTIPTFAVGYVGYKTMEGLEQRMRQTEVSCCPDGVLVLEDPGLFIYSRSYKPRVSKQGVQALYGLITEISFECVGWSSERPSFESYLET